MNRRGFLAATLIGPLVAGLAPLIGEGWVNRAAIFRRKRIYLKEFHGEFQIDRELMEKAKARKGAFEAEIDRQLKIVERGMLREHARLMMGA